MAQALSIVGEAGIHGMEYNGLVDSWLNSSATRRSQKFRVSLFSAHRFSGREFEDYLILAWRFGLLERSKYQEHQWKAGTNKSGYSVENEEIRLTREGWEFIEQYDKPWLHRAGRKILEDWPTILFSMIAAVGASWALFHFGPPSS